MVTDGNESDPASTGVLWKAGSAAVDAGRRAALVTPVAGTARPRLSDQPPITRNRVTTQAQQPGMLAGGTHHKL